MEEYIVITFDSTHVAIDTERLLSNYEVEMIPTPRQLSSNCGLSLKGSTEILEDVLEIVTRHHPDMCQCYKVSKKDGILTFKKV
ncbi:MAG: DUF3343 domain-containing protein [Clostridia bacterium]|nr:DUF3343 domain-containing protein [Clostridia bacterium]